MSYAIELLDVDKAVREIAPEVVKRHRLHGILTWALIHQIESEILDAMAKSGEHSKVILHMIRSAPVMGYPKDDRPATFNGAGLVPIVFSEIERAWNLVH